MKISRLKYRILNSLYKVKSDPIFFLGNEKSGTTAIAALVSKATGLSCILDIPQIWNPIQMEIHDDFGNISKFIRSNRYFFSKSVIKEPCLTFELQNLLKIFPAAKFVLIVRDPRDNIRSILNRLKVPGTLKNLDLAKMELDSKTLQSWRTVLDNRWLLPHLKHRNFIHSMALRWNFIIDSYYLYRDRLVLVKYEDFLCSKEDFIIRLCEEMDLDVKYSFDEFLDFQFQPKGDNTNTWREFYGDDNYRILLDTCRDHMRMMKYQ